jgi:uncharacterized protein
VADIAGLMESAKSGDLRKVREALSENFLLASQRLPNGESPLMAALYRGHYEVVEALVAAGAEVDVFAAAATGRIDDLRRTADDVSVASYAYDGWTPLHLAAFFGHLELVEYLLKAGAAVGAASRNSMSNTPLHAAVAGRHTDVALALLKAGADPAAVDAGGYTPLEIARQNGLDAVISAAGFQDGVGGQTAR